ncbi:hypothetical protein [Nonomuraea rubra]|uniref:hypothetical protein n=1 Tax=Nonomuraea rubra TaxID=46180 RepID=UPI0036D38DFB
MTPSDGLVLAGEAHAVLSPGEPDAGDAVGGVRAAEQRDPAPGDDRGPYAKGIAKRQQPPTPTAPGRPCGPSRERPG